MSGLNVQFRQNSVSQDEIDDQNPQYGYTNAQQQYFQYIQNQNLQGLPLIQPTTEELDTLNQQQMRKQLILKINSLLLYQQFVQVALITLCFFNPSLLWKYENFFYYGEYESDYYDENYLFYPTQIRMFTILIVVFTFVLLVTVRFYRKVRENKQYYSLIYILFFVLYTLTSHSITLSSSYLYYQSEDALIYYKLYIFCLIYSKVPLAALIMLIQFHFQLKKNNDDKMQLKYYFIPIFYIPILILWFFNIRGNYDWYDGETYDWYIGEFFTPLCPFLFTLFYIPSLLQIYKGKVNIVNIKFKLQENQAHIGSVMAISNMFFLCFKD